MVQNVSTGKLLSSEEVAAPCRAWENAKKEDKAAQLNKKGWNVASEDLRGGSFADTLQFNGMPVSNGVASPNQFDQKITLKRNE